jgi:hypothetical protein
MGQNLCEQRGFSARSAVQNFDIELAEAALHVQVIGHHILFCKVYHVTGGDLVMVCVPRCFTFWAVLMYFKQRPTQLPVLVIHLDEACFRWNQSVTPRRRIPA